jgi:hypothetical protein
LQSQLGEKQVLESQLSAVQVQLNEANQTIVNLQSQQVITSTLEVDSLDFGAISDEVEELKFELEEKITALNKAELQLVEQDEEINNLRTQLKQTIIPPIPASVTSITSKTNKKLAK